MDVRVAGISVDRFRDQLIDVDVAVFISTRADGAYTVPVMFTTPLLNVIAFRRSPVWLPVRQPVVLPAGRRD